MYVPQRRMLGPGCGSFPSAAQRCENDNSSGTHIASLTEAAAGPQPTQPSGCLSQALEHGTGQMGGPRELWHRRGFTLRSDNAKCVLLSQPLYEAEPKPEHRAPLRVSFERAVPMAITDIDRANLHAVTPRVLNKL